MAVGNLTHSDFTTCDVVRLLAGGAAPRAGRVPITGQRRSYAVRWLLETLLSLTTARVAVNVDPARLRPSDVPVSVCDNRRLVQATGWQPQIALRDSLHDVLNYWREQLRRNAEPAPSGGEAQAQRD